MLNGEAIAKPRNADFTRNFAGLQTPVLASQGGASGTKA